MKSLIIDRPELMTLKQKYANNFLRIIFILIWIYFLIPLFTFIAWYLAFTFFEQHLLLLEGYKEYKTMTSIWYLIIIATFAIMIILWSLGNLYFKTKKTRSISYNGLSIEACSDFYKLPIEQIQCFRNKKNFTVHFDETGEISELVS